MEGNKSLIIFSLAVILLAAIFLIIPSAESKSSDIVITEIAAYEYSDCEWIEIYNKSDKSINLKNYNFYENSIDHRLNTSSLSDSFEINPQDYAVIANNSANIINTIETSTSKCKSSYNNSNVTLLDSSWGNLKESGEKIGLKNNKDNFIEKFTYITDNKSSLERKNYQKEDYTKNNWSQHSTSHTIGKQNSNYIKPKPTNKLPLARINAPTTTTLSKYISFSASSSTDPDGNIQSYKWKTSSTTKQGPTTTFQFHKYGTKSIELTVTDGNQATDTAKHTIEVLQQKQNTSTEEKNTTTTKVQANIKAPATSTINKKIKIDGSASTSSPSQIKSYYWQINNSTNTIASSTQASTTISFSQTGTHKIYLKITNKNNKSDQTIQNIKILESQTNNTSTTSTPTKENTSSSTKQQFASTSSVKINEVFPDPSQNNEWIELYNSSNKRAKTKGWKLFDGANQIDTIQTNISSTDFKTIVLNTSKLNNSGDIVSLKNKDKIIDKVTYGDWDDGNTNDNAEKPKEGNSIARSVDGDDSNHDKNDFKTTNNPTKGEPNKIQISESDQSDENNQEDDSSNTVYVNNSEKQNINPSDVVVNELVSNPAENKVEFVELYNNTNESINLNDWWIEDESESKTYLTGNIPANQFYTIEKPDGRLNNSGDIVKLFAKNEEKIDQVEYKDNNTIPQEGESLARKTDGKDNNNNSLDFKITTKITKDSSNIIEQPEQTKEKTKPDSKNKKEPKPTTNTNINKNIKIIELLPSPLGKDKKSEYITIKNLSDQQTNLKNWELSDQADNNYIFKDQNLTANQKLKLHRKTTNIALNNGQESVKLIAPKDTLVDKISYEDAKTGKVYVLNNKKWDWYEANKEKVEQNNENKNKNNTSTTSKDNKEKSRTSSKKKENENFVGGYLQLDNAANLEITEVLPNPEGSDNNEFIEIYNPTNKTVELGGLKLDDEKEGSSDHTIKDNTKLKPKSYFVFAKKNTGITLNNTSDQARIMYPDKSLISKISYKDAKEGSSFNGKRWSSIVTPGFQNKIKQKSTKPTKQNSSQNNTRNRAPEYLKTTLKNIPDFKEEQKVQVRGIVATTPETISSRYFYIVGSPGLQIYNHNTNFPDLQIGDRIEVKGELSQAYGEWRLKTEDKFAIRKIDHPGKPKPEQFNIAQIGENYEGGLAQVQGEITEIKSNYFFVDDGTAEIKAYTKPNTGINIDKYSTGDLIKTTGIVSQRSDEYRLLPRKPEDITKTGTTKDNTSSKKQTKSTDSYDEEKIEKYLIATAGAIIVILFTLLMKEKNKNK